MSSKELLLKELEDLNPLEIIQIRSYLRELKSHAKKEEKATPEIDMNAVRQSLSNIKGSMSDFISNEREDRI